MKHGLCIIGYGGMGGWHTEHALKSDVVELIGIHDIKEERNKLAESRGIKAFYTLEEVLENKDIEFVTIAIPNDVHEEVAIACMNAGKHVISEKPVTLSCDSLERMIAASEKNNVLFSVHQNRRWDVDYLAIQKIFDTDAIGDVFSVESRIHGSRGIPSDWRGIKKYGGGMLYDWGVHLIDQLLMLYRDKKIESVFCEFEHLTNDEVDDGYRLTINFENGARAYSEVGTYNFIAMPRFYARGRKGSAVISDWREPCKVVECFAWHENDVLPVKTAAGLTKTMAPRDEITTKTYDMERPISDVHNYYRNFCACIEGKQTQIVTHQQMRRVLKVIEAGFESVEKKQPVKFDDVI
ncbi:MAG: Gfo/Idh/MocA family oxidoreductase [Clostridia bacterium]|nr:Gfo/Idh/MocA family oxidoreductase [Oscillospiraceae bacterium]MBQ2720565.1 Gfo/Idh/MocA family oxidoreductase [Clostridia bacterium]